ncbi:alpha/beta fold hydrolase [Paeniglutamicibacter psychrophenolicus]|uniref:alpha/beta fold hydrolase n=1 Tax=Paeniglutamicibacter psychrophenolicus TaxID=257454 RepID=UPI00277F44D1|nr:alpha/beta hydrolase [Paeniglutamicibacter psychrophenolicus]MDQ0093319.1 pimeloyl-ACP methyl ester carboxylesterase [Paeniglutamicibacter psychrophenolicus]
MQIPLRPEDLRSCRSHPRTIADTAAGPVEYADRGQGEPILAVHGTLGGCDQGLVATEFFRVNGFRIIAPSRPGYLGTPLSTGSSPAEQADALAALLDEIGINGISVFGGSGGGPAAYALAARHPEKVSRLLQVDSISHSVAPVPFARLGARDPAIKLQLWFLRHSAAPMLKFLFRRFGQMSGARAADLAAAVAADPVRIAHLEAILLASSGWAGRREGLDNDLVTFRALAPLGLEAITCPTLIMHASGDATVPPENARNAHERIPGSELYWMEGSHLSFFLEEGDTAPGYALEWLRGNSPAGRVPEPGP